METISLCGMWDMVCTDGRRFSASVPGSVLQTLLAAGDIPDPFDGTQEYAVCNRTRETYSFVRRFELAGDMLKVSHADLVFEGLDTLAEVRLNSRTVARTDNMHRTWRIPVRDVLREGANILEVIFSSALDAAEKVAGENPEVTYTGGSERAGTWAIRKAHYMFGWDWGPCLPDAGIWRPVRLEIYDCRLEDIRIRQAHDDGEVRLERTARSDADRIGWMLLDPEGALYVRLGLGPPPAGCRNLAEMQAGMLGQPD